MIKNSALRRFVKNGTFLDIFKHYVFYQSGILKHAYPISHCQKYVLIILAYLWNHENFFLLACQRSLYFTQGSNVMSSIAAHHAILLALFSGLYKAAAKRQL